MLQDASAGIIFVVDDDPFSRNVFTNALRARGFHVMPASTAGETIAMPGTTEHIDLVIMDLLLRRLEHATRGTTPGKSRRAAGSGVCRGLMVCNRLPRGLASLARFFS